MDKNEKMDIEILKDRFEHINDTLHSLRALLIVSNKYHKELVAWSRKTRRMLEKYLDENPKE